MLGGYYYVRPVATIELDEPLDPERDSVDRFRRVTSPTRWVAKSRDF